MYLSLLLNINYVNNFLWAGLPVYEIVTSPLPIARLSATVAR